MSVISWGGGWPTKRFFPSFLDKGESVACMHATTRTKPGDRHYWDIFKIMELILP